MMPYFIFLLYILAAFGVGYLGRNTRIGWFGSFILSLIITPPIMMLAILGLAKISPR